MWTHFWDMHSGGGQKEKFGHCYIEAPENEAKVIFYNRFGHNPERVFMNPPYGREIGHWIQKAYQETEAQVVCLIPARTDTKYWHEFCMKANEIWFIEGRLKFGDGCQPAPFPSSVVVFNVGRSNNRLHTDPLARAQKKSPL